MDKKMDPKLAKFENMARLQNEIVSIERAASLLQLRAVLLERELYPSRFAESDDPANTNDEKERNVGLGDEPSVGDSRRRSRSNNKKKTKLKDKKTSRKLGKKQRSQKEEGGEKSVGEDIEQPNTELHGKSRRRFFRGRKKSDTLTQNDAEVNLENKTESVLSGFMSKEQERHRRELKLETAMHRTPDDNRSVGSSASRTTTTSQGSASYDEFEVVPPETLEKYQNERYNNKRRKKKRLRRKNDQGEEMNAFDTFFDSICCCL